MAEGAWVPGAVRWAGVAGRPGEGVADDRSGASRTPGAPPVEAAATGPAAKETAAHNAQAVTAAREENPIVIRST